VRRAFVGGESGVPHRGTRGCRGGPVSGVPPSSAWEAGEEPATRTRRCRGADPHHSRGAGSVRTAETRSASRTRRGARRPQSQSRPRRRGEGRIGMAHPRVEAVHHVTQWQVLTATGGGGDFPCPGPGPRDGTGGAVGPGGPNPVASSHTPFV